MATTILPLITIYPQTLPARMNAPTFDSHSSTCPICRRSSSLKSGPILTGLLVCDQCQERLVISWSGHYVRDPFHLRRLRMERSLRRESHPVSRILRDLRMPPPQILMVFLASTLLIGMVSMLAEKNSPLTYPSASPSSSPRSPF